jgi:uncharacterized cupredoxin-like copper-binding protein
MKRLILAVTFIALGALAVACGGYDNSGSQTATNTKAPATSAAVATTAAATATPAASGAGTNIDVKIQEWSINPAVSTAPAGDVTFNIKNIGPEEEHEFVILKTDLTTAQLTKKPSGAVDEEAAGITSPGEVEGIGAGAQTSKTFNLTPGHYIFICNLIDQKDGQEQRHFDEGMHTEFNVQ